MLPGAISGRKYDINAAATKAKQCTSLGSLQCWIRGREEKKRMRENEKCEVGKVNGDERERECYGKGRGEKRKGAMATLSQNFRPKC